MKLYHGTSSRRAKLILSCNEIKPTDPEITQYALDGNTKTTFGYVYLSKSINEALGFGLLSSNSKLQNQEVIVFEAEVDNDEIEIDKDEEYTKTIVTQVKLPINSSVRIKRKLILKKDVTKYVELKFKNYDQGCEYTDDPLLEAKLIDKWISLT